MKKKVLAAIIIAVGLLTACGQTEGPAEVQTLQPLATPTPEATQETDENGETASTEEEGRVADTATIEEREIVDGQMQSYLTGEWKDAEIVQRRNMAVMIPNNRAALPQYGISKASVIYEAPVEGRITRLMALFEDYDDLDRIGPIRSSRDYYVYEAMAYDSIYVNWGLAIPFVAPIINTDRIDNISQAVTGIDTAAAEAFDRVSRSGYAQEYTGYMFIDGYNDAVERLKYDTTYEAHDRFEQAFTFANDGHRAEYESYPDATQIYPGGTGNNSSGYGQHKPCFTYDESDGLYYRTQYGAAQKDEMNDEQLTVSNVVFKICHGEVHEPTDKDYLAFEVHGSGDAYVFTNGKVIKGTWERDSDYAPNLFLDEDGNEIVFNQGKTWICCIWEEYEQYMTFE